MTRTTSSVWSPEKLPRLGTPLEHDLKTEVCVVGGGIAGLTTGYLLASRGHSVVLLEANDTIGSGETGFTTAHLAWVFDDRFARVSAIRGDDATRAASDSHRSAIALIEKIAQRERIDCDFEWLDAYLFAGTDGPEAIEKEVETLRRIGMPFERLGKPPLGDLPGPCLRFAGHAHFHPMKYLAGLAKGFRGLGGTLHTGTRVRRIEGGDTCTVTTKEGRTVRANSVVVATNSPFDAGAILHTKLAAYTTYALAFSIPRGVVPHALFWDTEDPYHYVRIHPGVGEKEFLIVGGEDHKTGQADDQAIRWHRLESWTRARIPDAGPVEHHWSGQVFETPDGLGLIGAAPWGHNLYVITGDSGMGITHGTLGAKLLVNLIRGQDDPLAAIYDPSRWMTWALRTFLGENLNLAAQYRDWFTGGDVKSVDQIPPGHGAIVRRGLSKLAVYKENDGSVCEMSATCRHLGALVRWNPGEQTWDCPAHGSRYSCDGKVLHGPAHEDLKPVEEPVAAHAAKR